MINISISTNILVIISCIILFVIIGLIAFIIYKDKKIDQEEIDDLIDDIVKAKPRERKEEVKVTKIESTEPSKLNLEQMLNDMQTDLNNKKNNKIEMYEKDQDENAIISIKELEKLNNDNIDRYEKEQELESIISYKDLAKNSLSNLEEKVEMVKKPVKKAIAKVESNRDTKKFKSTEFISPIFGKMDEHTEYPKIKAFNKEADLSLNEYFGEDVSDHSLEQSLNVDPLSDEIKRNSAQCTIKKPFHCYLWQ
jgi:hypothetical protein